FPWSFSLQHTATSDIFPLSLHDALPISSDRVEGRGLAGAVRADQREHLAFAHFEAEVFDREEAAEAHRQVFDFEEIHLRCKAGTDRKSTRLNSSHRTISYAVFCLKKKNQ